MKLRLIHAAVLLIASLNHNVLSAQETTGAARVGTDSNFDASYGDGPYTNSKYNSEATFSSGDYGNDSGSWSDLWDTNNAVESNGGLLGKKYVRAAYVAYGVDDPLVSQLDDKLDGGDIEVNVPNPWFDSDDWGSDFFAEYERRSISGVFLSGARGEVDQDVVTAGTRLFAWPRSRFRPYFGAAFGFSSTDTEVTPTMGARTRITNDDTGFVTNLGFELDLARWAAVRADFEIFEDNVFEGVLILWPHEHFFVRGGVTMPFEDGFDAGGTIGGGIAF